MDLSQIRADLSAEQADLDALLMRVSESDWSTLTSSPGWTVADQIGHLAFFDRAAAEAIGKPATFEAFKADFWEQAADGAVALDDFTLKRYRCFTPTELLDAWRADRRDLANAASELAEDDRVEWLGPSMGSRSFLTARLMEVWAHGQDIVDALGLTRAATDRLESIAKLGFITRSWSFLNRDVEPPDIAVRVVLAAPSGAIWEFGDAHTAESIEGPAEDFCAVVTQRRHIDDTALAVRGSAAREWMLIAQAFAGPPTNGPSPRV